MPDCATYLGPPLRKRTHIARGLLAFVALMTLAIGTQLWVGAYQGEFQGDATGHYVSGLVIHDYIVALLSDHPGSPIHYVAWFHGHYPLVGIGHWPPAYYLVEAVWMLCFSPSLTSLLMLSATVTGCTAWLTWYCLHREFGATTGYIAAGVLVILPVVQHSTAELMLDVPVAMICLAAAIAFARYLATPRPGWSALFGMLAAIAILTKGNGLALALLPPFALLYSRRFDLLRRPSFWVPLPIVAVLTGPWYILTYGQVEAGFRYHWGFDYSATALRSNAIIVLMSAGPVLTAAAAVGLVAVIIQKGERNALLVSMAALLCAVWTFQSVVPAAIQNRYLIPLFPPLVILAVHGVVTCMKWIHSLLVGVRQPASHELATASCTDRRTLLPVALVFATAIPFAMMTTAVPAASFAAPADAVWAARLPTNPAVLLAVPADREGTAVADLAMRDPDRPSLFAIRGSRLLGGGGFNNQDYIPLYNDLDAVSAAIDHYAIPFVLFSSRHDSDEWQHISQIEAIARRLQDRWKPVKSWQDSGLTTILYRIAGNDGKSADTAALLELSAPRALATLR